MNRNDLERVEREVILRAGIFGIKMQNIYFGNNLVGAETLYQDQKETGINRWARLWEIFNPN